MKTVIFDFDGTIADTFVTSIRIFERLTKRATPFAVDEIERLRGLHALQLIRELRIRPWRVPWLLVRGRAMMRRELPVIKVFEGIEDVFKQLQADDIDMYIMSSNSTTNIRRFLRARGMDHYFKRIYGNVGVLGKAKMLRRIIARSRLDPNTTAYVGDEGRDIEAAKRVGITSVAVNWGFSNDEILSSHEPSHLASTREELLRALRG